VARKPRMMAANQSFWSGDTFVPIGALYPEDHPEVKGREPFFSEIAVAEMPAPPPAAAPAAGKTPAR
jgi:hypothetical protein